MESNQLLRLQVIRQEEWDGDLDVVLVPAEQDKDLRKPGVKTGELLLIETGNGHHRLLVSLGPKDKVTTDKVGEAGGAAAKWLVKRKVAAAAVQTSSLQELGTEAILESLCEGLLLGAYRFDRHKSKQETEQVTQVYLLALDEVAPLETVTRRVAAVTAGVNLARDLAHEPPNVINPASLAERARALAERDSLKCTLLGEAELGDMGAGAILSVGLGSKTPSQMIILEYPGEPGHEGEAPVIVVGKAITFDTGGYSLKDRTGIVGMKYDKSGGAAVLGIMQAVAALKPAVPVVGVVAAAENMISAEAYRPNDIIRSLSGKTIEIISTDAEGRLVLADALTYAHTHYQPRALIDLATLTGGIVVALGNVRAGLMINNDDLAEELFAAGELKHERLWRMPLDEDYFELIKGDDSDIKNSSGIRQAHPIVGGIFLRQFVPDEVPWAHLDIAGPATTEKDLPYNPKGATGFGVRLVLNYLQHLG
ncbi:MAG: leucyl aminopeptidase [Anaerolineales bacterium]|nr:MAG: leucyl aminopeptidase [Anaerolineales bacterium]